MKLRFLMYTVTNVITEESSERGDYASSECSEEATVTLREAFDALCGGCWDNIDSGGEGVIIAYPADYDQSMATGDWSADELIITATSQRNAERLLDLYDRRERRGYASR